jgi:hypothetical protein
MAQVIECLRGKHKALVQTPVPQKKKKKQDIWKKTGHLLHNVLKLEGN